MSPKRQAALICIVVQKKQKPEIPGPPSRPYHVYLVCLPASLPGFTDSQAASPPPIRMVKDWTTLNGRLHMLNRLKRTQTSPISPYTPKRLMSQPLRSHRCCETWERCSWDTHYRLLVLWWWTGACRDGFVRGRGVGRGAVFCVLCKM